MLSSPSRFLFLFLVVAIAASVSFTYWKTIVQKDFVIINDVEEEGTISQ